MQSLTLGLRRRIESGDTIVNFDLRVEPVLQGSQWGGVTQYDTRTDFSELNKKDVLY